MRILAQPSFSQPAPTYSKPATEPSQDSVVLGGRRCTGLLPSPRELAAGQSQEPGPIRDINRPGELVNVEDHLVPGKTNIICYWATWCPWSQKAQPKLAKLCAENPEFVCLRVDIATFDSPVAGQHGITKVPSYAIYGTDGKLVASGEEARARVKELFKES